MSRDYAKRSSRRTKKINKTRRRLWSSIGCLAALSIAIYLLLKLGCQLMVIPLIHLLDSVKEKINYSRQPVAPTFEFYNILAQDTQTPALPTSVQEADLDESLLLGEASSGHKLDPEQVAADVVRDQLESDLFGDRVAIILVIGTFRDLIKASHFQAKMTLQGLDAQIRDIGRLGKKFHQVYLGPYPSIDKARQEQESLHTQDIESILDRIDVA